MRKLWVGALVCAFFFGACRRDGYEPTVKGAVQMTLADVRFEDGDTFFYGGRPIRVLGVDTPEIAHLSLGWDEPQPYGVAAAESTQAWMTRAELIELLPDGKDYYGRRLAHVFIDRELLAVLLIRHGLGYETVTRYGDNGFPDLAQQVLDAWQTAPKPLFEPPGQWRQKHRKKKSS